MKSNYRQVVSKTNYRTPADNIQTTYLISPKNIQTTYIKTKFRYSKFTQYFTSTYCVELI
ncbi:MAG: hypothetical protein KIT33_00345 [Candidatus Kapabacteria bacterium]|nr:hypothetical protein [Ignavibacteriota bacterium]MCW5883397.1 hypothetical protein [Candidatus Kapabacteria bacterium]